MTYQEMREIARSGDVLLVRGNMFVRVFTAESYSHVAVLVWMPADGGLWVFEFVEGRGFQSMPASQWFAQRKGEDVLLGRAPRLVRSEPELVFAAATRYRTERPMKRWYGYGSLLVVWASQLIGRRLPVWLRVCSTYAQEVWEAAGWQGFKRTADPGDVAAACEFLTPVAGGEPA